VLGQICEHPANGTDFYRQIAQATQLHTDEFRDRLGTVDIPVLVCWGTRDSWIPPTKAQELTDLIPGARLRLIDDAPVSAVGRSDDRRRGSICVTHDSAETTSIAPTLA
jgi:predicted alpha/beta hydrolase